MKFIVASLILFLSLPMFAESLQKLKEGNVHFAKSRSYEREKLIASQSPFCALLACADSRVAPELIFHQSLGDLFVVRIAGNVATQGAIESLDFASNILKVSLIVVMGHQHCGAVDAVMTHKGERDLGAIASIIQPSAEGKQTLKEAVIANVKAQVKTLQEHELLTNRINLGSLEIVGAYYDFSTGLVEFF